ncbi:hypothetical protein CEUSTIGMA_g1891.t1 [Chlamydomonas eustigma]|uniref:UspA domain-containing protein n=1 Tax=Chlamydomonas eustigma TaxID=1157962 RepID=A0A250WUY3_9CHLO|nr:hypothetical protein CEUSTIGMA_g1891.t1 [Chlamydomonas eustigma]|eukprot:GAX74442.1 hypothetical protein CEUSTIGMA_g1891.t1 [Chlamydomonas eustigma]
MTTTSITSTTSDSLLQVPKTVMVAVDGSPLADHALSWCLVNVLQPQDHLHLVTVARSPSVPVLDEPAAVAAMELQHYSNEVKASIVEAQAVVRKAMEMSERHGVLHSKLVWTVLNPQYGNSNIGEAMCGYVNEKDVDLVVIGSRGFGAWKKLWLDIVDLGSVSDYVAKHVDCPVVVVKCESSDVSPHFHPPAATNAVINSSSSAECGITGAGVHAAEEGEEQLLSLIESGSLLPRVDEEQLPMVRPDLSPAAAAATASIPPATTATPLIAEPAPTVPPVVATASVLPDPLSIHEMDGNSRPAAAAAKDLKNCTPATPASHNCEAGVAMRANEMVGNSRPATAAKNCTPATPASHKFEADVAMRAANEMGALRVSEPPDPVIAPDTTAVVQGDVAEM